VNGVSKEAVPEPAVAYCEDCDRSWLPDGDDPDPTGYCHRAAQQHARDTRHTAVVAVGHLTKYAPEVKS
jgi:hypothetical protein